ncbi:MAG TPA: chemotaxis protein CheW [Dyella sp.]|uniref:chemotaxis protein CheW n=1 Tax=Dyella sp. TaxID=1869338 RepID=UPI002D798945|nr:chemotaxis protein CheW [Dyella sp.]HET6552441.1 chemotaxis protein CheW [Dyella sp.]
MSDIHHVAADRWLSFRIGGQLYAAPLAQVSEVIRDGEITPVPGAASELLGIRHLRGRIVPVLDGRQRLGLPEHGGQDDGAVRVVMLSHAAHLVGLRVDAVGDLVNPDGAEVAPPPPGGSLRDEDPVHGVLPWQGGFVALLDVRRLCRLPLESEAA